MNFKFNGAFLKGLAIKTGQVISKNSPIIAASLGVIGLGCAVYSAIKATPKAMKMVEEAEAKKEQEAVAKAFEEHKEVESTKLSNKEKLVIYGKCYWKTAALTVVTAACTIGAVCLANRQTSAMALLYGTTATTLEQYKNAAKEVVGEKKERQIHDKALTDSVDVAKVDDDEGYIDTGYGKMRLYEPITGRLYFSDIEMVRRQFNELNAQLLQTGYVTVNDYLYALGLGEIDPKWKYASDMGWRYDSGYGRLIEVTYTSGLSPKQVAYTIPEPTPPTYLNGVCFD